MVVTFYDTFVFRFAVDGRTGRVRKRLCRTRGAFFENGRDTVAVRVLNHMISTSSVSRFGRWDKVGTERDKPIAIATENGSESCLSNV
jgi:hypothetical protein